MDLSLTIPNHYKSIPYYKVLAQHFKMSQGLLRRIRLNGSFRVEQQEVRLVDPARGGEVCHIHLPAKTKQAPAHIELLPTISPTNFPPFILYEDEHFIALVKPQNMVTHPCLNHQKDSLLDCLGEYTLHPITRLDRDTFGIVLIGKNPYVHQVTSSMPMTKEYLGFTHGRPIQERGTYEEKIARLNTSLIQRQISNTGQDAKTSYQLLHYDQEMDISLLSFYLHTGRTHQIRLHSMYHNHPLVGDTMYTHKKDVKMYQEKFQLQGQALLAYRLSFYHPIQQTQIQLTAPLPKPLLHLAKEIHIPNQLQKKLGKVF